MASRPVREAACPNLPRLHEALQLATEPMVFRGLVAQWPVVQAARGNDGAAAANYLRPFHRDATVDAWLGPPEIKGRFFYNEDLKGFNFQAQRLRLDTVLDALQQYAEADLPPALYVGSTTVDTCLPGFRDANDLPLEPLQPLASLWLGNRTRVAAHHDLPDNLACVVAGHRRFTLFPPDQVGNLYIGPIDFTPAGQPISLVDMVQPDLAAHPRFAQAQQYAQVAELEPGDALFIPSMWWHQVEALDGFNALVNYWWRSSPPHMDSPMAALMMAMMSVRDLPTAQRQAWRALFAHYVFDADDNTVAHLPSHARGALSPLDADAARVLRARLRQKLNR